MFKSKSVLTQVLFEEKSTYETWNKLAAARTRASIHQLKWAQGEANVCLFHFFGALAELRWMWNESIRQAAEKQLEFSKVFKNIFQDERVLEETRKALEACRANMARLQKQLETGKKKQEHIASIEHELNMQQTLCQHIETSIKEKTKRLELYKVELVRKGAMQQAEALLLMAEQLQKLCLAQTQLAELLPLEPSTASELHAAAVEREMESVVHNLGEEVCLFPPKHGGIDTKKLTNPSVDSYDDQDNNVSSSLGSKAHSLEYLFSNSSNRGSTEDIRRVKRISYPLPMPPKRADPTADVPIRVRPASVFMDSHAVIMRDKPFKNRRCSSADKKHMSVISIEEHNEATILDDACFDAGMAASPGGEVSMMRLDSGSCGSSGGDYADPVDALQDYIAAKEKGDDPSYATLEEIRKLRDIQIAAAAAVDNADKRDDPGYAHIHEVVQPIDGEESPYSRPFDCLDSQGEPVRISSRSGGGAHRHAHRCMSPLTLRRVLSPTGEREELVQTRPMRPPVSELLLRHRESLHICKGRHQPTTFSDESRSPTPSDEGLDDRGRNTDGEIDSLGPLSLAASANVSVSQPELIAREEGVGEAKEEEDLPQTSEGPMKRLKSFLRYRAGSDGHIAARARQSKLSRAKVADKDIVEQFDDTAAK